MQFDAHGHVESSPRELYQMAVDDPRRLLTAYLTTGTPHAFPNCQSYCKFLVAISDRIGVHPRNLYMRGSCHISYSIAPRTDKAWIAMRDDSDLDLVIVDSVYFHRFEEELRRWEIRNPVRAPDRGAKAAALRAQDRLFNLCRDESLPPSVCVHHQKAMESVAKTAHCGRVRNLNAFIYPDWHSAQVRYEYDLRKLREGIEHQWIATPPEMPLPAE